jgi:hypothetical protein
MLRVRRKRCPVSSRCNAQVHQHSDDNVPVRNVLKERRGKNNATWLFGWLYWLSRGLLTVPLLVHLSQLRIRQCMEEQYGTKRMEAAAIETNEYMSLVAALSLSANTLAYGAMVLAWAL